MRISDWSSDVCSSDLADTGFGNAALRAARQAFTGREVELSDRADPLAPVAAGGARMALVEADAFFDLSGSAPVRNERFEAVAAVGQSVVPLLSRTPVDEIGSIVAGRSDTRREGKECVRPC